jgi:hypothetical protein
MASIRNEFEKRDIIISLRNDYEEADWTPFLIVQYIIDNHDIFDDFYVKYPLNSIDNEDDFYLYLLSIKIESLRLVIPRLKQDEHKVVIEKITNDAGASIKKISIGLVIKYINQHYEELLNQERTDPELRERTADIIGQYSSNGICKSALDYIAENDGYMVIDRFEDFEKAIENDTDLFHKLFPTGHLSEIDTLRYKEIMNIWAYILNKEKSSLKALALGCMDNLYNDIIEYANGVSQADVFQKEGVVREFSRFLQKINSPKANEITTINKKIQDLFSKELDEKGQSIVYEVPVGEILNKLRKKEPWAVRMLMLTCTTIGDGGTRYLDSQLNYRSNKPRYFDFAQSNIPTDSFFTSSHQQWLSIFENVHGAIIAGILRDEEMKIDYLKMMGTVAEYYTELTESADESLKDDVNLLLNMIQLLAGNENAGSEIVRSLCYGTAMFTCAIMEKALRIAYVKLAGNDRYIQLDKVTLGEMLSANNPYFSKAFGEDHLRNLAYYLVHIPPENIGRNYRNSLAHWTGISTEDLEPILVDKLLWLLNDVFVTLILYFERHNKNPESK